MHAAFDVYRFVFPLSELLRLEHDVADSGLDVFDSSEIEEVVDVEMFGPVQQVGQIKVLNVVASYYIWVDFTNEI